MSNQKKNGQQLAAPEPTALALDNDGDELAGLGIDIDDDGLEQLDRTDVKIAAAVLNFKGTDAAGRKIREDAYYNTVDETVKDEISAALLYLHKSNLWSEYNTAENRTQIKCRSFDRVTGTMEDGTARPCEGCPDAQWRTENGKRTRRCGPVYNMFAIDRDTQQPFVIRCKRTSLPVIKAYLQKHFIGRRVVKVDGVKKLANYPLCVFETKLTVRMSDDKKYALPVFNRLGVLPQDEIASHGRAMEFLKENLSSFFEKVEEHAESREAPDTSFDTASFSKPEEQGQSFVETPAA